MNIVAGVLLLLSAGGSLSLAQIIARGELQLSNAFVQPVTYSVSCDENEWVEQTLASHASTVEGCQRRPVFIRISTNDEATKRQRSVRYRLEPGKRYQIGWNATKHAFDVFEMLPRK
jgi:hypothetical protein